jgi:hypothetical protein
VAGVLQRKLYCGEECGKLNDVGGWRGEVVVGICVGSGEVVGWLLRRPISRWWVGLVSWGRRPRMKSIRRSRVVSVLAWLAQVGGAAQRRGASRRWRSSAHGAAKP